MHLFIILTSEEEICVFEQNSNSVVMCCISMDVLRCNCVPCFNSCQIREMAGSTGTDVKSAYTP